MICLGGIEATARIRAWEKKSGYNHRSRIVVMTGMTGEDDRRRALEAGADEFMTKPARLHDLGKRLEIWKKERELEIQNQFQQLWHSPKKKLVEKDGSPNDHKPNDSNSDS